MVVTLCGEYEDIERIEKALRESNEFQLLDEYETELMVSVATGKIQKESSGRLVFANRERTVKIFVREPGEMRVRVEGNGNDIHVLAVLDDLLIQRPKGGLWRM